MSKTVTFETKVWENDWVRLLENEYLKIKLDSLNYKFNKKMLMINNVNDYDIVMKTSKKYLDKNLIDEVHLVKDYENEVLKFFNIEKESFNGGYYYSISELTAIFLCETDFLLHLSGDSIIDNNGYDWITPSIEMMTNNEKIICSTPTWNHNFSGVDNESVREMENNWVYTHGFSDQCYLINVKEFKKQIYNDKNLLADIHFPTYGGESFEKRVYSYMKNNELYRIVSKETSYLNPR